MLKTNYILQKLRKTNNLKLLWVFKGRTTLIHSAFCVIVIVPAKKQMNIALFWGPDDIFVCLLVSCYDLNESLKPLQHGECQKNSNFPFYEKIGPPCRKMAKMRLQAGDRVGSGHTSVWALVARKRDGNTPLHENIY